MRSVLGILVIVSTGILSPSYAQNQGEIRLGAISGVVTDALTRETIPGAVVTLIKRGGGLNVAPQYTDAKGRFVFPSLPTPATYQLRVSRIGYLDSAYAAGNLRSELGDSIELESGIWLSALSIVMQHPSAISGVVADSNGEPVVGASVRVLRRMPVASRWRIVGSNVSVTDDLGRYRVSNLVPGDYVVSVPSVQMSGATSGPVVPQSAGRRSAEAVVQSEGAAAGMLLGPFPVAPFSSASPRVYVTTYFPGASSLSNASVITLTAALERRGVDFHLRAQRAFRVSGSLQGVSPTGCLIRLLPADDQDGSAGMEIAVTRPDPRGAFSFPAVPPGQYTLQASSALAAYTFQPSAGSTVGRWSPLPIGPSQLNFSVTEISFTPAATLGFTSYGQPSDTWGTAYIDVSDKDVSQVLVMLQPATSVRGSVEWDADTPPQLAGTPRVRVEPSDGSPDQPVGTSPIAANSFTIPGLTPGRYYVTVAANKVVDGTVVRAHVKSVRLGSRSLPHSIVEVTAGEESLSISVTLTFKGSTISGDITPPAGASATKAWVVYFPADQGVWGNLGLTSREIGVVAVEHGQYKITDLPAGQYYLAATVDDLSSTVWQEAGILENLAARGQAVTIEWGDSKNVRLALMSMPK